MTKLLLNSTRMAKRLGVEEQWLVQLSDAGKVPGLRTPSGWLYNVVAVEEAIAVLAARPSNIKDREMRDLTESESE